MGQQVSRDPWLYMPQNERSAANRMKTERRPYEEVAEIRWGPNCPLCKKPGQKVGKKKKYLGQSHRSTLYERQIRPLYVGIEMRCEECAQQLEISWVHILGGPRFKCLPLGSWHTGQADNAKECEKIAKRPSGISQCPRCEEKAETWVESEDEPISERTYGCGLCRHQGLILEWDGLTEKEKNQCEDQQEYENSRTLWD